jgi:hypothetical protein
VSYKPGSYSQDLRSDHQNGDHVEQSATHCPSCLFPSLSRQPSNEELLRVAQEED